MHLTSWNPNQAQGLIIKLLKFYLFFLFVEDSLSSQFNFWRTRVFRVLVEAADSEHDSVLPHGMFKLLVILSYVSYRLDR